MVGGKIKEKSTTPIVSDASAGRGAGSRTLGLQAGRGKGLRTAADYFPGKWLLFLIFFGGGKRGTHLGGVSTKLSPVAVY